MLVVLIKILVRGGTIDKLLIIVIYCAYSVSNGGRNKAADNVCHGLSNACKKNIKNFMQGYVLAVVVTERDPGFEAEYCLGSGVTD